LRTYSPWEEELSDPGSSPADVTGTQQLDFFAAVFADQDARSRGRPDPAPTPRALSELLSRLMSGQLARFLAIGVASTVAYMLLYLVLSYVMPALAANALSMLITAVANTAANRRLTFGVRGSAGAARHQVQGLLAFAAGLLVTSGALWSLHRVSATPGRATELAVLVVANLVATAVRFVLYRLWVFGGHQACKGGRRVVMVAS
jgi:putative flippase GtrA